MSGKLRLARPDISPVAVGDYVEFNMKEKSAAIENVIERKSCIAKPAVEKEGFKQVLISNVDRLVIVTSVAQPRFNHGIVERFLVIAFKEQIQPVVVLNKIDLKNPSKFSHYFEAWEEISCQCFYTSAKTGKGMERFENVISSGTSVIVGHSGVGKSSLLNRMLPDLNIKTKMISSYSGRGVHTTSRVSLYKISDNGWVADTPGLKVLGFSDIDKSDLQFYFPDIQRHAQKCHFADCRHIDEPSCGVKEAMGKVENQIPEFRYDSYKRIYESLKK
ncbi:MAG: ribosome small subunit-dependent GTPase A [Candidatus Zixiibacteriota bacterium]|nr:MAG: ribosome small subunit-dependent GTPase A [candidate division Zixibacteria bacterium]